MATKVEALKCCCTCRAPKPLSSFNRSRSRPDGLYPQCRSCRADARKRMSPEDRARDRRRSAEYYRKNRDRLREAQRRYYHDNRVQGRGRAAHLKRNFGITNEEYDELLAKQGGVCAVCRNPETESDKRSGTVRRLAVDHDHETGRVRGLLCRKCNTAAGLLADDPCRVLRMANYLLGD